MKYLWMSFCDTDLPIGSQFLGVIISTELNVLEAASRAWDLGINPGGEIASWEIEEDINPDDVDKFLTKENLIEKGYIDNDTANGGGI